MPIERKKKSTTKDELIKRKNKFKRKIRTIFTGAGFSYIPTNDREMRIGNRKVEVDMLFLYKNIWLICEDTVKTSDIRGHIRTKNEAFGEIKANVDVFINKLVEIFPDKKSLLTKYNVNRIKIYGLYISQQEVPLEDSDYQLFSNLIFVQPQTLEYFHWIESCIKITSRNEIFRFLGVSSSDIGLISSSSSDTKISAPIIYPKEFTGLKSDIRVVSFMMSAEDLLNMSYVLRKDNWEDSIRLYQRLIDKTKLKKIRRFIEQNGEAFFNNIIVCLPDEIMIHDKNTGQYLKPDQINNLNCSCELIMPKELNSICIIDGQHRVFAHYESGNDNKQEREIGKLRKQLHLLVTGLIFPPNMSPEERIHIQSGIFLDINSNSKPVSQGVLLQIKRMRNPIADESIAQYVLEQLNKRDPFQGLLQTSSLQKSKIKTASIVRFALKYLVTVNPSDGKKSLYSFWNGDKTALKENKASAISDYVHFCTSTLAQYFSAIKSNYSDEWKNENSKLLSVISINGFIIALTRQLIVNGVKDFNYYDLSFNNYHFDFSKDHFPYTSSQYRQFSTDILRKAFSISEEILSHI